MRKHKPLITSRFRSFVTLFSSFFDNQQQRRLWRTNITAAQTALQVLYAARTSAFFHRPLDSCQSAIDRARYTRQPPIHAEHIPIAAPEPAIDLNNGKRATQSVNSKREAHVLYLTLDFAFRSASPFSLNSCLYHC